MNKGKIIAIIGAQRTGKSYLCEKLSQKLGYEHYFEGENGIFPQWLSEDIKNTTNTLRRVYWFRNKLVQSFLESKQKSLDGRRQLFFTHSPQEKYRQVSAYVLRIQSA